MQLWHKANCCFYSGEGCSISGFDCGDGQCIPGSWQCDREVDCNNGADEKLCKEPTLH